MVMWSTANKLLNGAIDVGRGNCGVPPTDKKISRRHCIITETDGKATVKAVLSLLLRQ